MPKDVIIDQQSFGPNQSFDYWQKLKLQILWIADMGEEADIPNAERAGVGNATSSASPTPPAENEAHGPDLEALAPVTSGPAYSAFSKREKQYIVFMVTVVSNLKPSPTLVPYNLTL